MARSSETFGKKEKEKKRLQKKKDKQARREERKEKKSSGGAESMMAYVDEHGNIIDSPPDPTKKTKIDASTIELGVPKREEGEALTVRTGKVAFFNDSKGFGFIKDLDTQEDFFVHVNGLIDDVQENDKVTFELERGMKGMNAVEVKLAQ